MYNPPICLTEEVRKNFFERMEDNVYKAVIDCKINVNKEELFKALNYDRQQYEKGLEDSVVHAHWISSHRKNSSGCFEKYCSNCEDSFFAEDWKQEKFCRNCGAKMDEEY